MRSEGRNVLVTMMTDCLPGGWSASRRKCSGNRVWLMGVIYFSCRSFCLEKKSTSKQTQFNKNTSGFPPESLRSWQSSLRCTLPRFLAAWHPVWWHPASWTPTLWWQEELPWQGREDGLQTPQLWPLTTGCPGLEPPQSGSPAHHTVCGHTWLKTLANCFKHMFRCSQNL